MGAKTHIETQAFEVEDEHGHRSILIRSQPVSVDENGNATTLHLGVELRLRNGESVIPLSETEFESAHGKRWRKVGAPAK
jgi:hypothetical protein